jgi:hypothetical protein
MSLFTSRRIEMRVISGDPMRAPEEDQRAGRRVAPAGHDRLLEEQLALSRAPARTAAGHGTPASVSVDRGRA